MFILAAVVLLVMGACVIRWPRSRIAMRRALSGVDESKLVTDWERYDAAQRIGGVALVVGGIALLILASARAKSNVHSADMPWGEAFPLGSPQATLQDRFAADSDQLQSLRKAGVDTSKESSIEHEVDFASRPAADEFRHAALLKGFEVDEATDSKGSPSRLVVHLRKIDVPDLVTPHSLQLIVDVLSSGGTYRGWRVLSQRAPEAK